MFKWILDILLPKFCVGCGREGLYICKDCEVFLSEVDPSTCEVDASTSQVTSVWEYEGLMEKLIHKIKFDGCYHIIDELVEKAMAKINLKLPEDTVISFVPMRKNRERQRGFNQSELIARKLAAYLPKVNGVHLREVRGLLEKIKDNRSQVGLGPKERIENVRGVFAISSDADRIFRPLDFPSALPRLGGALRNSENPAAITFVPKNVLLVDDVYTTGATVNECKKVLKAAGVKNILVFTLARKLRI